MRLAPPDNLKSALSTLSRLRRRIAGHVDRVEEGDTLIGWAADLAEPSRRVTVECVHEGRVLATATANAFREDIKTAAVGDGSGTYAFKLTVPSDVLLDLAEPVVQVRVQGTTGYLNPRETRLRNDVFLWFVAGDIVNNCNLRCPFCLVDYSGVTKTQLMAEDTFKKLVMLASSVPDGQFFISCLHEPTLHPKLNHFLTLIPEHARQKVFFTTNLARPLKAADFEAWANSGLHHINISLDTLDAERFAVLRKFGRFEVFKANLELMTSIFAKTPDAPKLHYITMAFRSNFDEIAEIVKLTRERWLGVENEIRYTFNVKHITDDFRQREYLHKEDWPALSERLDATGYKVNIAYPPADGYEETIKPAQNFFEARGPSDGPPRVTFTKPMGLRAAPDGTILVSDAEDALRVNINSLEDPVRFFRSLLRQAQPRTDGVVLVP